MGFTFEEFPDADYYRSDLRKILKYIRDVNAYLKTLDDIITELQDGLKRLGMIEENVDYLLGCCAEVQSKLNYIEASVNTMQVDLDELTGIVNTIEISLNGVYDYINNKYNELLAIHDEDFYLLLEKLNQSTHQIFQDILELSRRIDGIDTTVYNSWVNRRMSWQENEDFIFNHLANECPTAEEYMSLELSANEYSALDITSRKYQEFGKKYLHMHWVNSPVYGWRQEINNVLCSIANFAANTMSSNDYSALDLTADEYSALNLSSMDYFKYNPNSPSGYVEVNPMGMGLTVDQYHHLQTV